MDGEWSDGVVSSRTMSGGGEKQKAGGDGVSVNCPGSPPAAPSAASPSGRRRSVQKRVVTVPLADVSVPRPKGVGEGNTPTDSWAWRKYGQKPIKGSPFPRAYYRCSSSKGCPARKQVERSRAEPDTVIVTYSYEHNHFVTAPRAAQQNRQAQKPKPQPGRPPEPAGSDDTSQGAATGTGAGAGLVTDGAVPVPVPAQAIEVHDEFRWLYDVVSVTSSASPSDIEAADDMLLYGPMFYGAGAVVAGATAALLPDEFGDADDVGELAGEGSEEEDAMFAGLGELPECAMVFRRHAGDGRLAMAGGVKVEQPAEGTAMT